MVTRQIRHGMAPARGRATNGRPIRAIKIAILQAAIHVVIVRVRFGLYVAVRHHRRLQIVWR